jgi:hypothetical protein
LAERLCQGEMFDCVVRFDAVVSTPDEEEAPTGSAETP